MFQELRAAVLDLPDVSNRPTPSLPPKVVPRPRALILLVDDDPDRQRLMTTILRRENYRVSQARDGVEALLKAGQLVPSVIVMELCLPRLDGWSAIRLLKVNQRTRDIPIVAVTRYGPDDVAGNRAKEAGCDVFLEKPLPMFRLLACVRRLADAPQSCGASRLEISGADGARVVSGTCCNTAVASVPRNWTHLRMKTFSD